MIVIAARNGGTIQTGPTCCACVSRSLRFSERLSVYDYSPDLLIASTLRTISSSVVRGHLPLTLGTRERSAS